MTNPVSRLPQQLGDFREESCNDGGRNLLSLDLQLWIEVLLLIILGVVMIYSASFVMSFQKTGDTAHYVKRQLVWIILGLSGMIVISRIDYRIYESHARWILLAAVAALLLVLIPGIGVKLNNARRWVSLGYFNLQPAEFAKVAWIIFLSSSLAAKQERIKKITVGFLPPMIWCGILAVALLLEPDFGTAFIISLLTALMLTVAGVPIRHLLILAPIGVAGLYHFVYLVPYRWERITAFMNPWTDPLDSGYQLIQAWIAVGSGGIWGKGLGAGHQKLFYLPESFTDFIMAVIGEEMGFVGILAICLLFFFLFWTGLKISQEAPDTLGAFLALGITMLLCLQALLNMGVVLGLAPTKGLPLPFISYGGSAFTANCLAIGILMSIARTTERH
ncbi:putative lipid II flippase FtsW [Desulfoferrobacter suflitae]|uniref:putative lipid II flippase FtsW n=1 Tax=Desulfoferrobacter suflitae TaxID=2865782 RepID=UPI0021649DFC|nr:putative lipid II flippase FtsW [Desulfoferrobacter suflitae]MCK8600408.1 putative lipid II flippase FtsW [Desulfoferrobacter suflitae]